MRAARARHIPRVGVGLLAAAVAAAVVTPIPAQPSAASDARRAAAVADQRNSDTADLAGGALSGSATQILPMPFSGDNGVRDGQTAVGTEVPPAGGPAPVPVPPLLAAQPPTATSLTAGGPLLSVVGDGPAGGGASGQVGSGDPTARYYSYPADNGALGSSRAGALRGTSAVYGAAAGVPTRVLSAYQRAAAQVNAADPSCHLSWAMLAGIGKVESDHARNGAVTAAGETLRPILGPVLSGGRGVAAIHDTDGGRLDGDPVWDRAVGPMQFIPGSWRVWGADGNGDGVADPSNIDDAAVATGRYLCAGSRDLGTPTGLAAAVFTYNHSASYVDLVVSWIRRYAAGGALPVIGVGLPASGSGSASGTGSGALPGSGSPAAPTGPGEPPTPGQPGQPLLPVVPPAPPAPAPVPVPPAPVPVPPAPVLVPPAPAPAPPPPAPTPVPVPPAPPTPGPVPPVPEPPPTAKPILTPEPGPTTPAPVRPTAPPTRRPTPAPTETTRTSTSSPAPTSTSSPTISTTPVPTPSGSVTSPPSSPTSPAPTSPTPSPPAPTSPAPSPSASATPSPTCTPASTPTTSTPEPSVSGTGTPSASPTATPTVTPTPSPTTGTPTPSQTSTATPSPIPTACPPTTAPPTTAPPTTAPAGGNTTPAKTKPGGSAQSSQRRSPRPPRAARTGADPVRREQERDDETRR